MMMDRDRISFWTRIGAFALIVLFLATFLFAGLGTGLNIDFLQAFFKNRNQPAGQQHPQTVSAREQIRYAESYVKDHPKDPAAVFRLGYLYAQDGKMRKAGQVLEKGRKDFPKNAQIAMLLGDVYAQQAQSASGKEQKKLYGKAADAFAGASKIAPSGDVARLYLAAGEAYQRAGQPGLAVKYWNKYLDKHPKGKQADQVRKQISDALHGGSTG